MTCLTRNVCTVQQSVFVAQSIVVRPRLNKLLCRRNHTDYFVEPISTSWHVCILQYNTEYHHLSINMCRNDELVIFSFAKNKHSRLPRRGRRPESFRLCLRSASGASSSLAVPGCCRTCGPSAPVREPSLRQRRPTRPLFRPREARRGSDVDDEHTR